jgi:hypothetical protein
MEEEQAAQELEKKHRSLAQHISEAHGNSVLTISVGAAVAVWL